MLKLLTYHTNQLQGSKPYPDIPAAAVHHGTSVARKDIGVTSLQRIDYYCGEHLIQITVCCQQEILVEARQSLQAESRVKDF